MTRITIADVALAAGVGLSTVDRVMNGRRPVRPETAARVLDAAERIGFYGSAVIRQQIEALSRPLTFDFILLQRAAQFYRLLGDALIRAAQTCTEASVHAKLHYLDDVTPRAMAAQLTGLIRKSDGVAIVASDHNLVSQAIADLAGHGTPTVAIITDLTAPRRRAYVGHDFWKIGRTAGWSIAHLATGPGKVGVVIGSHRYLSQDAMEIGFRSYFREKAPGFQVLEPLQNLETASLGYEATLELLVRHPDMRGLYLAGGGQEGVIQALREFDRPERLVTVCMALTDTSAEALRDDVIQVVLDHPCRPLAEAVLAALIQAVRRPDEAGLIQTLLPFEIVTSENL